MSQPEKTKSAGWVKLINHPFFDGIQDKEKWTEDFIRKQQKETEELEAKRQKEAYSRAEAALPSWLRRIGVPKKTADVFFRQSVTDPTRFVSDWLETKQETLMLMGSPGCGKTVASIFALASWRMRPEWGQGQSGATIRDAAFFEANSLASASDYSAKEFWEGVVRAPVLVVDDLGAEAATEKNKAALASLVHWRDGRGLRTVYTTNFAGKEFVLRYPASVVDRLRASGPRHNLALPSMRVVVREPGSEG